MGGRILQGIQAKSHSVPGVCPGVGSPPALSAGPDFLYRLWPPLLPSPFLLGLGQVSVWGRFWAIFEPLLHSSSRCPGIFVILLQCQGFLVQWLGVYYGGMWFICIQDSFQMHGLIEEHEQIYFISFKKMLMICAPHPRYIINIHWLTEDYSIGKGRKDGLRFICIVGRKKGLLFPSLKPKWPVSFSLQISFAYCSWLCCNLAIFQKALAEYILHMPGSVLGIGDEQNWKMLLSLSASPCGYGNLGKLQKMNKVFFFQMGQYSKVLGVDCGRWCYYGLF